MVIAAMKKRLSEASRDEMHFGEEVLKKKSHIYRMFCCNHNTECSSVLTYTSHRQIFSRMFSPDSLEFKT